MKKNIKIVVLAAGTLVLVSCSNSFGSSSFLGSSASAQASSTPSSQTSSGNASSGGASSSDSSGHASSGASSAGSSSHNSSSSENSSRGGSSSNSSSSSSSSAEPSGEVVFSGTGSAVSVTGHYFDPLQGVTALSENGVDVTKDIEVIGSVQYGKAGTYSLAYKIGDPDLSGSVSRTVTVADGAYTHPERNRSDGADRTVAVGSGSYRTGSAPTGDPSDGNAFHRPGDPGYIDNEVYNQGPVPTNKWWSGFTTENYGGVTVAALNPLDAGYTSSGLYISDKGTGFTQYFSVADTKGVSQTTMSNFCPAFKDLTIKPASLGSSSVTKVIGYDDDSVAIAMRNSADGADEMVTHLVQGSPYIISEFKDPSSIALNLRVDGVTNAYEFYDLSGNLLTSSYSGNAVIVKLPGAHLGYATTYPNLGVGAAIYGNLFYLLSVPAGTSFSFSQGANPSPLFKDKISVSMTQGNYLSVCALNDASEAAFYQAGAYGLLAKNHVSYAVDKAAATATTEIKANVQYLNGSEGTPVMALMPHQWKNSSVETSGVTFQTMKGTTKLMKGNSFTTETSFAGILPSFTLPDDAAFSSSEAKSYLDSLISDTTPGTVSLSWDENGKHYINAPGPYWNGKALYPLCQGLIISDQLGLTEYEATIKQRIRDLLTDWYTYSGTGDIRYLYYDQVWGSLYYSVDNFSTGSRLSDHHFTAGYLIYGTAVLAMYDPTFLAQYGGIARLLLDDYMNCGQDSMFPSFRGYDPYASHNWADGKGDFGDGNDQESCGESLNSWTAGYLLGTALGDSTLVSASAWGFANELIGVKQYWFNYDENNWVASLANYTHVIGILWGCKNDFATWFGSNPEFIYGIHWLPTGEYLSSYALGDGERATLLKIYNEFLGRVNGAPRTWYSNMWAIQALVDPAKALSNFDASKIEGDDYPDELSGSYWMIHALQTLGQKDVSGHLSMNDNVAGSVYVKDGVKKALLWNPSNQEEIVNYSINGTITSLKVSARSFTKVSL
jgi:endoglucanase Acf2